MENPLVAADDDADPEQRRVYKPHELLACPKKALIVVGYTKPERMNELRHTISLKRITTERLQERVRYQMDINEKVTHLLRHENELLRLTVRNLGQSDQHLIAEVLREHKPERLQLCRSNLVTATSVMDEWLAMRKNVSNLIAYTRRKVHEILLKRYTELQFLDQLSGAKDGNVEEANVRILTEIDKTKIRLDTAVYIRDKYLSVIDHYEEPATISYHDRLHGMGAWLYQEALHYQNRLDDVRTALQQGHTELQDILSMHNEARQSRDEKMRLMLYWDKTTAANKRRRETTLDETRKNADKQTQEFQQYARRRKAEAFIPPERDVEAEERHANILQKSIKLETMLDNVKLKTQAPNKQQIVEYMVRQMDLNEDLLLRRQQIMVRYQDTKRRHEELLPERERVQHAMMHQYDREQEQLANSRNAIAAVKRANERTVDQLTKRGRLVCELECGVSTLYERLIDFTNPYADRSAAERSSTLERRQSNHCVVDEMNQCVAMFRKLLSAIYDADPTQSVAQLMTCPWFGEISLNYPVPRNIRISLLPPEGSRAQTDFDFINRPGFLTREMIKRNSTRLIKKNQRVPADSKQ